MANMKRRRNVLIALGCSILPSLAACIEVRPASPDPVRSEVDVLVSGLERGLRIGGWSAVERYYSDDYRGNISDLEDSIDARRRSERSADWMLVINRILEQDQWVNVSLRWNRRWTDASGKPNKAEGVGELILRREAGGLRIVQSRGLPF